MEKIIILKDFKHGLKEYLEKNREATETIKTVIAQYSQSPDYSYFRNQVGAVIASLNSSIAKNPIMSNYNGKKAIIDKDNVEELSSQKLIANGTTYGFAHDGKIYLNPDVMNSNASGETPPRAWRKPYNTVSVYFSTRNTSTGVEKT